MRLILVGGGLANSLIADRLSAERPEVELVVLEAGSALGGNHTWSFHETDLTAAQNRRIDPLVSARWPAYDVAFPKFGRRMPFGYRSIASERLDRVVRGRVRADFRFGTRVTGIAPTRATLESGEVVAGDAVIDGRGYVPSRHLVVAYQKFHGLEVRTRAPHGLDVPIVMDATVPQRDGYRFVYTLPFAPDRLLIEDTYYSDNLDLDVAATRALIDRYALARGWTIAEVLREERGVLPIGLGGDPVALWAEAGGVPRSGLRAGLFHPTTGYSLPEAVRLADGIATMDDLSAPALFAAIRAHAIGRWRANGIYRLLDRLMFRAAEPDLRYRLLERFYRLSPGLIARFYAGESTGFDKARVLTGKPPVPIGRALRCLREGTA